MQLSGRNTVVLDAKGRLAVPQRFRQAFPENEQDNIVLTRGFDPCITGYYESSWETFLQNVFSNEISQEDQDLFEREFIGRVQKSTFDKQGRITLPQHLLDYANLINVNEVTVIGIRDRIEIWNPDLYEKIRGSQEDALQALRGKLRGRRQGGADG